MTIHHTQDNLLEEEELGRSMVWNVLQENNRKRFPSSADKASLYSRAKALCLASDLKINDVVNLTPKFWDVTASYSALPETAVTTILSIHWNLCMGTIAKYLPSRPDLLPLLQALECFDINGQFMLTELGHGLDAKNLETTAVLQADGSFELNTPHPRAAKAMPPSSFTSGVPRIAVVFAQLIVRGENRGIRPFIVPLCTASAMRPGVSCKMLPSRPTNRLPVDHALTSFRHVRLESNALLGSLDVPTSLYRDFFEQISRVAIGAISLTTAYIPVLELSAYIAALYSLRRKVTTPLAPEPQPIVSFSTQHRPILVAFSLASIFRPFRDWITTTFCESPANEPLKRNLACIFKATVTYSATPILEEMTERLGWQGLMSQNQVFEWTMAVKGIRIAEGDALVLCIRLVSELLAGRYTITAPNDESCLLARHEQGLIDEARGRAANILASGGNSREELNAHILPRCTALVEAIGQRMAYESALASGKVPVEVLRLFEVHCLLKDPSWYVENAGMTREELFSAETKAFAAVMPLLGSFTDEVGRRGNARAWISAPILDDKSWAAFVDQLPDFGTVPEMVIRSEEIRARL